MKIFVFEFFSAGGMAGTIIAQNATSEGQAILNAVLRDFSHLDNYRTVTCLSPGMQASHADETVPVTDSWEASFNTLVHQADGVLIIAPEEAGCLADLSQTVLDAGTILLGSSPESIRTASNKDVCAQLLLKAGIPFPETVVATLETVDSTADSLGYPLVVKPLCSQDCEGVSLVLDRSELDRALDLLDGRKVMLLQRYHQGTHASVTVFVSGFDVTPLCLNEQRIVPGQPFVYRGGSTPFKHHLSDRAMELAAEAVRLIPGLGGYVGVDMVLKEDSCLVIEINPRLTTAYVGVSETLNINLAEAILHGHFHGTLPQRVKAERRVEFSKEGIV